MVERIGPALAKEIERLTLDVYERAAQIGRGRGILLADTKLEFGHDSDGVLRLGDEVLTPDSSRFWPADAWQPGHAQPSFDKQYVRDWLAASDWDRRPPGPGAARPRGGADQGALHRGVRAADRTLVRRLPADGLRCPGSSWT